MEASSMTLPARDPGHVTLAASPACESLFRAEYGRVVGIAQRVLGDQAEAEDVAQDVFVSFYRGHPADAPYARAWLHAAAAHAALNALRGRDRRSRREAAQAVPVEATAADDPAVTVAASETRQEVRAVLARLTSRWLQGIAAAAGVVIVASALTLSGVAGSIFQIFEPKSVVAVPVTRSDLNYLGQACSGLNLQECMGAYGTFEWTAPPQPREVQSRAQASAEAGFAALAPTSLPSSVTGDPR